MLLLKNILLRYSFWYKRTSGYRSSFKKAAFILAAAAVTLTPLSVVLPASAATLAHISGQITDQNGQEVNDATVALSAPGTSYIDIERSDNSPPAIYMSALGSNYSIYAPVGLYNLVFLARINDNLLPKVLQIDLQTDTVLNEQLVSGTLPTSTISGRITDSSGNPASGLQVEAKSINDDWDSTTTTDTNGAYSLSVKPEYYNLFLGCYTGADCEPFSFGINPDNYYYVTGSNIVQNFVLPDRTRTLSVTVLDSSGNPVANQMVHATAGSSDQGIFSNGGDFSRYAGSSSDVSSTDSTGVAQLHFFNNSSVFKTYLGTVYSDGHSARNALDDIPLIDQDNTYTLWDDMTPPSIGTFQWSANPLALGQTTTLSVPITDNLSGVAQVNYDVSDGEGGPMASLNGKWVATLGENIRQSGTYTVDVYAYDKMGNRTDFVRDNLVAYDGSLPTPSNLTISSPTQNPALSWDAFPGATSYNIYRDRTQVGSSNTNSYFDSSVAEGSHTYYVTAMSGSGETGPSNQVNVLVDRTAPVVGVPQWTANPITNTQSTTVSLPTSDNLSGVLKGEYFLGSSDPGQGNATAMNFNGGNLGASFSNMNAGIYTINFRAEDNAGNWSPVKTDYLVVYNPTAGGMSGHANTILPVYGTDVLPGLIQAGQPNMASFALSAKYDSTSNITPSSKVKFSYSTGSHCNNASQAMNCHSLALDSTSISWLIINGTNNSQGIIQGVATITVDGVTTTNPFSVVGVDGALLNPQTNDTFTIQIFAPGDDPNTASPLYHINAPITKGSIKIS